MTYTRNVNVRFVAALAAVVVLSAGCGSKPSAVNAIPTTTEPPRKEVLVTTPVLADFVSVLGNDRFDVKTIVPRDVDPRTYVMTSSDVTLIANADMIIQSGTGLEPWLDTFMTTADHRGTVVNAGVGVSSRVDEGGGLDPYTWVSPANARVMVLNVRNALEQLDPDYASVMEANERAYDAQIDNVISYEENILTPLADRRLTYVGEPLGYYCDQFHLTCTSVPATPFTSAAPVAAQVTALQNTIRTNKSAAVVFSDRVNQQVVDAVKSSTTAKVVSGPAALRAYSLGDGNRKDYLSSQRNIADTISDALR